MKTFRRILNLGASSLVLVLSFSAPAFSQTSPEDCNSIYQNLVARRGSTEIAVAEQALASGKEYQTKCKGLAATEGFDKIDQFINLEVPRLQEKVDIMKLEQAFDAAVKKRSRDDVVSTAKQLIEKNRRYNLDLMLDIASVGFDNASAAPADDKYNADAIRYATLVLEKLEKGEDSGTKDKRFGFYFPYKNEKCADGKINAAGWMNYTIGFITSTRQKETRAALPYLYKSSQAGCETKAFSESYRLIGSWYVDESNKISAQRAALIKAASDTETPETVALLELQMGYLDRAIDAYARAYRQAATNLKTVPAYKTSLQGVLKELFAARYEGDISAMDAYVAKVMDTPFIDPATPVAPVKATPVKPVETAPAKAAPGKPGKKTSVPRVKKAVKKPLKKTA
ncbi:MAG TPA: hypothetical protein VMZ26_08915 [Pyrinomonadaceae bacterium]|nr:hypothetical protein [Pyrinomonadaceae bacterium]